MKISKSGDNLKILIPVDQVENAIHSGSISEETSYLPEGGFIPPSASYSYRMIFPPRGNNVTVRPEVAIANWFFSLRHKKKISLQDPYQYFADASFIDKVSNFQKEKNLKVDGTIGPETWKALSYFPEGGSMPPLYLRAQVVTAEIETGHVANTYGFNTGKDIGDGAGVNFGIVQHNSRGSLNKLLTDYAPVRIRQNWRRTKSIRDLSEWMGSAEGVEAQNKYYKAEIYDTALHNYSLLTEDRNTNDVDYERFIVLLCDIAVQNGIFYSSYRSIDEINDNGNWGRFLGHYIDWILVREKSKKLKETFTANTIVNRKAMDFVSTHVTNINDFMVGVAMYRSRCSRKKYMNRVEQRKLTIAVPLGYKGWQGEIHGKEMDMYKNFGIGLKSWIE